MSRATILAAPRPRSRNRVNPIPAEFHANLALLSAEEEIELARRIALGDQAARTRMIRSNLLLVAKIAHNFEGRGMSIEDLIGEGNLGLIRATETYDAAFGTRFSTYASYWIKESIRSAVVKTAATIRLPAHMVLLLIKWRAADRELKRANGQAPSAEQIAALLGLSESKRVMVEQALRAGRARPAGGSGGVEPPSTVEPVDPQPAPETRLENDDERESLRHRLDRLSAVDRQVITLRFGLESGEPLTLTAVGALLGKTREWVRKVETRAIKKMR